VVAWENRAGTLGSLKRCGIALLIGVAGGAIFLFLFPGGALSTLMHEVLHLPGPGAGIALVVGPIALLCILLAASVLGRFGGATLAAVGFSGMCVVVSAVLTLAGGEKGMFGSPWFIAAIGTCGLLADILLWATKRATAPLRFAVAAAGANIGLLLFFWLLIFPRTKGWVLLQDVPVLLAVCLAGGLVAGALGWILSKRIPGILFRLSVR